MSKPVENPSKPVETRQVLKSGTGNCVFPILFNKSCQHRTIQLNPVNPVLEIMAHAVPAVPESHKVKVGSVGQFISIYIN
jgi:hypothetical protein